MGPSCFHVFQQERDINPNAAFSQYNWHCYPRQTGINGDPDGMLSQTSKLREQKTSCSKGNCYIMNCQHVYCKCNLLGKQRLFPTHHSTAQQWLRMSFLSVGSAFFLCQTNVLCSYLKMYNWQQCYNKVVFNFYLLHVRLTTGTFEVWDIHFSYSITTNTLHNYSGSFIPVLQRGKVCKIANFICKRKKKKKPHPHFN